LGIGKVGTKKWEQEKGEWVEEEVWGLLGFEANVCVQIFFVVVVLGPGSLFPRETESQA
jgi:hypothetical protein